MAKIEVFTEEFKRAVLEAVKEIIDTYKTELPIISQYDFINRDSTTFSVYAILDNFSIRDKRHGHLLDISQPEISTLGSHTEIHMVRININDNYLDVKVVFH